MRQMAIPFTVGPDGAVDHVSDPVQSLADRVRALTATAPGERVMRAVFGVATADIEFAWDASVGQQLLEQRVRNVVAQWEPSARVLTTQPIMNTDGSQVLGVNVDISAGDPTSTEAVTQYSVVITGNGSVSQTS
jgi:phage baseplate assembly protein W